MPISDWSLSFKPGARVSRSLCLWEGLLSGTLDFPSKSYAGPSPAMLLLSLGGSMWGEAGWDLYAVGSGYSGSRPPLFQKQRKF